MEKKHRPVYHMLPEQNWMNDPNGPIYYNGTYHLFYQHNPKEAKWGNIHWGHSVSTDLINWQHRPLALYPSKEEGELHCFSGSTVIRDDGTPMIIYTSVGDGKRNSQTGAEQWAAVGSMDLDNWVKVYENPVIDQSVHGDDKILEWRDPFVFRYEDQWMMVIGGTHQGHGCAALYRALDENLYRWEYLGMVGRDELGSDMWECPVLFGYRDRYVFMYSPNNSMRWEVGDFDGKTFTARNKGVVDYGGWQGFYAGNTCSMPDGRVVMFAWMPEVLRVSLEHAGYTWAGVQSIPRVIDIDEDDRLVIDPVESVSLLHDITGSYSDGGVTVSGTKTLPISGAALDIIMSLQFPKDAAGEYGISLLADPGGSEQTLLVLNPETGRARIDRSSSSADGVSLALPVEGSWEIMEDGHADVRILLDHSTLEIFIDSRLCLSTRIYPKYSSSREVRLFAPPDRSMEVLSIEVFPMKPASFS